MKNHSIVIKLTTAGKTKMIMFALTKLTVVLNTATPTLIALQQQRINSANAPVIPHSV
jgi:hypothetical protein